MIIYGRIGLYEYSINNWLKSKNLKGEIRWSKLFCEWFSKYNNRNIYPACRVMDVNVLYNNIGSTKI